MYILYGIRKETRIATIFGCPVDFGFAPSWDVYISLTLFCNTYRVGIVI